MYLNNTPWIDYHFYQLCSVEFIDVGKPVRQNLDNTHPNWHDRICYTYKDHNVLLDGLPQAKIITNTVEIAEGLPDNLVLDDFPAEINRNVRRAILNSHLFDAEQEKLPKLKDPSRPMFVFPRVLGITQSRSK